MKKIFTNVSVLCALILGCTSTSVAFNAEAELESMISIVQKEFYDGGAFEVFDGAYVVVPVIREEAGDGFPNGNLTPVSETELGLVVNSAMLNIEDITARLFAFAHELGHGFSQRVLTNIGCAGVSGEATEVVADLGAAYVLNKKGISWSEIESSISRWQTYAIFDVVASGDHPDGASRYNYIVQFINGLKSGEAFSQKLNEIVRQDVGADCKS